MLRSAPAPAPAPEQWVDRVSEEPVKLPKKIKTVVFDWNGTLDDGAGVMKEVVQQVYDDDVSGTKPKIDKDHLNEVAKAIRHEIKLAWEKEVAEDPMVQDQQRLVDPAKEGLKKVGYNDLDFIDKFAHKFKDRYKEKHAKRVRLLDGANDTVQWLCEQKVRVVIVSNKTDAELKAEVAALQDKGLLAGIDIAKDVYGVSPTMAPKPNQQMIREAGVDPKNAYICGDRDSDVKVGIKDLGEGEGNESKDARQNFAGAILIGQLAEEMQQGKHAANKARYEAAYRGNFACAKNHRELPAVMANLERCEARGAA